jgi:chorismate dehydratase
MKNAIYAQVNPLDQHIGGGIMLRIAHIPYLNAAPFYTTLGEEPDLTLISAVPRELGRLAQAGEIDAGLMAVADVVRQSDVFEPLGDLGVAVRRSARSVLLFSKLPCAQLDSRVIHVTSDTSTSVLLLRILLEERFKIQPREYVQCNSHVGADAMLLIGDEALRQRCSLAAQLPFITDLGSEWWEWTLLPFVFAMWVVRKDLPADDKVALHCKLQGSLGAGLGQLDAIAASASTELAMSDGDVQAYLENFIYGLGPAEQAGLAHFRTRLLLKELA